MLKLCIAFYLCHLGVLLGNRDNFAFTLTPLGILSYNGSQPIRHSSRFKVYDHLRISPIIYKVGQIHFETNFFKICLRAADISNLEFFKVISLQFFTVFPALQPLFKTVLKILNRNVKIFSRVI
jgi:hypothetical protein